MVRRSRLWPAAPAALLALALAGCAELPASRGDATQDPRWQARSAQLAKLRDWQLDARIGVNRDRQAWSASLKWQQHGPRYEIDLLGPFGAGRVRVEGDAAGVVLLRGDDEPPVHASDPDELFERATGIAVPAAALGDWLFGRPQPGVAAQVEADAEGRTTRIVQAGWTIEYPAWQPVGALELPAKLRAVRGDVQVRLAAERWGL